MHIPEQFNPNTTDIGSLEHIKEGISIIIDNIDQISSIHLYFEEYERTRAGIAAYSCGTDRIASSGNMDLTSMLTSY